MSASQENVVFVGTIVSSSALDRLNILKGFIAIENGKVSFVVIILNHTSYCR